MNYLARLFFAFTIMGLMPTTSLKADQTPSSELSQQSESQALAVFEFSPFMSFGLNPIAQIRLNPLYRNRYTDSLGGAFTMGLFPLAHKQLSFRFELGMSLSQMTPFNDGKSLDSFVGIGARYEYPFYKQFFLFGDILGGFHLSTYWHSLKTGFNRYATPAGYIKFGGGIGIHLQNRFQIHLGIHYLPVFDSQMFQRFFHNFHIETGVSIRIQKPKPELEIHEINLDSIFTAHYKYYVNNPIGKVMVKNASGSDLTNVRIFLELSNYGSGEVASKRLPLIKRGQTGTIELYTLLDEKVINLSGSETVNAQLTLKYQHNEKIYTKVTSSPIQIYHRNALRWNDTQKIASFITPLDPPAQALASSIISLSAAHNTQSLQKTLFQGIALFEGTGLLGITYVHDPASVVPGNQFSLDYIRYTRDLLKVKTGDCDDLTVLLATLFESVGIETAYILVPGHIFMMFDTGVPSENYTKVCPDPSKIIFYDGNAKSATESVQTKTVWVPIETTMIGKPFKEAWFNAASTYTTHTERESITIIKTTEAHRKYQPVTLPPSDLEIQPDPNQITTRIAKESAKISQYNFSSQLEYYQMELTSNPNDLTILLKQGVLLAQNEHYKDAITTLEAAWKIDSKNWKIPYNLGLISHIQKQYSKAEKYYSNAEALNPQSSYIYIFMAQLQHKLGNKKSAKSYYKKAIAIKPAWEKHYSHIISTSLSGNVASYADQELNPIFLIDH